MSARFSPALRLPAFPWDALAPFAAVAGQHPDGLVDLSVGTPVDPVPLALRAALAAAADAPGYPPTAGTPALRAAVTGWLSRRAGVAVEPDAVLPSVGSKETVALLPTLLGCAPGSGVVLPLLAYPTYDVGARMAGCEPLPLTDPFAADPRRVSLVWVNSPANPTGEVLGVEDLRRVVGWAREHDVVVASDECYLEFGWEGPAPVSILHPDVCGGSHGGLLAVHSLSKRSNLAGYRAGFVAGDPALVRDLLEVRKNLGLMVPAPVQAAAAAALDDDEHVLAQRARYAARRDRLRPALLSAGFTVDHSEAGLYLWARHPELDCWAAVEHLAALGILVAPGAMYGATGARHVRLALTAPDDRIAAAAVRLRAPVG